MTSSSSFACLLLARLKLLPNPSLNQKLSHLKCKRKRALNKAKKWSNTDQMASHSYQIMVEVIDKKLSLLTVDK